MSKLEDILNRRPLIKINGMFHILFISMCISWSMILSYNITHDILAITCAVYFGGGFGWLYGAAMILFANWVYIQLSEWARGDMTDKWRAI